jgi:acyl-coenzyme A synthetase/AMP-(fatty) acid ligase
MDARFSLGGDEAEPRVFPFQSSDTAFWRGDRRLSFGQVYHEAHRLADRLPERAMAINYCEARDHFTVALLALWMRGQTAVFPPDQTPNTFKALRTDHPDLYCLTDTALPFTGGDCVEVDLDQSEGSQTVSPPNIAPDHLAVSIFTSGSTGRPTANAKSWAMLVAGAQAIPKTIGFDPGRRPSIVATVPSQHMYGFEFTIMNVLCGAGCVHIGRPTFPADVARCLRAVPEPRVLVTTPVHMRALLESDVSLPPLDRIISATAPLSDTLASQVEQRFTTPIWEIYGFTEAGSVACRRTTDGPIWTLREDFRAHEDADGQSITWTPFDQRIPFPDVVEIIDSRHIRLRGRAADIVKIAGKRASLSGLTIQMLEVEGIDDAALWLPTEDEGRGIVSRLVAFVVAPNLTKSAIRKALQGRLDPAFAPRTIVPVESLPRNGTGKLPQKALADLAARYLK